MICLASSPQYLRKSLERWWAFPRALGLPTVLPVRDHAGQKCLNTRQRRLDVCVELPLLLIDLDLLAVELPLFQHAGADVLIDDVLLRDRRREMADNRVVFMRFHARPSRVDAMARVVVSKRRLAWWLVCCNIRLIGSERTKVRIVS